MGTNSDTVARDFPSSGEFTNAHRIGETGAQGRVWKAYEPRMERWVALKERNDENPSPEAKILAGLSSPYVVRVHGLVAIRDRNFIHMELVDGNTLRRYCDHDHLLPTRKILEVGFQIASVLEEIHEKGLVYRDLKPENVILDPEQTTKLVDMGQVVRLEEAVGPSGTPGYMSPIQADIYKHRVRSHVEPDSDVFQPGNRPI